MKNYAYIAQSLDGFIAGPRGELEWLEEIKNPELSDFGFAQFMASIDALLMGRNTFEKILSFGCWPYDKPVFVASNSLEVLPPDVEGRVTLIGGELLAMVETLRNKGYEALYIDGGSLIQSALREALLDELFVTTVPVLLGEGIPLFGTLRRKIHLQLLSSEVLVGQLVQTHYGVLKD